MSKKAYKDMKEGFKKTYASLSDAYNASDNSQVKESIRKAQQGTNQIFEGLKKINDF